MITIPKMIIKSINYGTDIPSDLTEIIIKGIIQLRFTELGYDVVFSEEVRS